MLKFSSQDDYMEKGKELAMKARVVSRFYHADREDPMAPYIYEDAIIRIMSAKSRGVSSGKQFVNVIITYNIQQPERVTVLRAAIVNKLFGYEVILEQYHSGKEWEEDLETVFMEVMKQLEKAEKREAERKANLFTPLDELRL